MRSPWILVILAGFCLMAWMLKAQAIAPDEVAQPDSQLVVTPLYLLAQVPPGGELVKPLFIANAGPTATLDFTVTILAFAPGEGIVDWLNVWPVDGSLPANSQTIVDVTFSPKPHMPIGSIYDAGLRVDSNSLLTPTLYTVPVFLEIIEAPPIRVYLPAIFRQH